MAFRSFGILAAVLAVLAFRGPDAEAHPHIWITNNTIVIVEDGKLVGLRHRWEFDEFFSAAIIDEFDTDGDGRFSDAERTALKAGAFDPVSESGYFTHVRVGGEPLNDGRREIGGARDFDAEIVDGRLVYNFTVLLAEPVALRSGDRITIGVYDQSYYVDVSFASTDSISLAGNAPGGCTHQLIDDADNPIYFGMVIPKAIRVSCAGS